MPGFGHHIPALLASRGKAQMCQGGSAQLAHALVRAVQETGGEIRLGVTPRRIDVSRGHVAGVETTDGELIAAPMVVSGLNPRQTFLELFAPEDVPAEWRRRAEGFRFNLLAPLFALNLNLCELPRYKAPGLDGAFMTILGLEHSSQFLDIVTTRPHPVHGDVGLLPDRLRSHASAQGLPYRVLVGEAALPSERRPGQLGRGRVAAARRC